MTISTLVTIPPPVDKSEFVFPLLARFIDKQAAQNQGMICLFTNSQTATVVLPVESNMQDFPYVLGYQFIPADTVYQTKAWEVLPVGTTVKLTQREFYK